MKSLQQHLNLIDETVKYYEDGNPRGIGGTYGCIYFNEANGAMCAVGRCLKNPKEAERIVNDFDSIYYNGTDVNELLKALESTETLDTYGFKDEYKGFANWFWVSLQKLHDNNAHWGGDGKLSEKGKDYIEYLKTRVEVEFN